MTENKNEYDKQGRIKRWALLKQNKDLKREIRNLRELSLKNALQNSNILSNRGFITLDNRLSPRSRLQ